MGLKKKSGKSVEKARPYFTAKAQVETACEVGGAPVMVEG
jgi:hypothetical protein